MALGMERPSLDKMLRKPFEYITEYMLNIPGQIQFILLRLATCLREFNIYLGLVSPSHPLAYPIQSKVQNAISLTHDILGVMEGNKMKVHV